MLCTTKSVGNSYSVQQKQFNSFDKSGKDTIGRTSDGYYIKVKTNQKLNVNAYATVNKPTTPLKDGPNSKKNTIGTVYYGVTYRINKSSGNWGYVTNLGGWINLNDTVG